MRGQPRYRHEVCPLPRLAQEAPGGQRAGPPSPPVHISLQGTGEHNRLAIQRLRLLEFALRNEQRLRSPNTQQS
jgi:hypothetical protein